MAKKRKDQMKSPYKVFSKSKLQSSHDIFENNKSNLKNVFKNNPQVTLINYERSK